MYKHLSFPLNSENIKLLTIPVTKLKKKTKTSLKSFRLKLYFGKIKGETRKN